MALSWCDLTYDQYAAMSIDDYAAMYICLVGIVAPEVVAELLIELGGETAIADRVVSYMPNVNGKTTIANRTVTYVPSTEQPGEIINGR